MTTLGGGRRFATLLFTDIVGSTLIASELGDERWRAIVARHHAIVRRELKRFGGHELDTAGDGFFAIFESAGVGIRCAVAICEGVREIGLEVRAGLHGGEIQVSEDDKPGGIAVNIAARVMSVAGFGEVLVSQTLRDVVAGSSLGFEDHGVHTLKGVDGEWHLYRVASVDGERVADPLDLDEASRRRLAIEPLPARRPAPRRRPVLLAAGAGAVAIAALLAFVMTRPDDEPLDGPGVALPPAGPGASTLVKVDAETGEALFVRGDVAGRSIGPSSIDVGYGSVWLSRPPLLLKVDPQDGSNVAVQGLEGSLAFEMDVGDEGVWVLGSELSPVDPATGRASESYAYRTRDNPFFTPSDLASGFGGVWITASDRSLIRVDPATGRSHIIDLGETPEAVAIGSRDVWVLDDLADTVWRVDPGTEHAEAIGISGGLERLAIGEGFVWVLDASLGTLTPIEEGDGGLRPAIDVGADASDVAVGLGSVWVASGGSILEIDPASFRVVRTIEIGPTPISTLAVDEDDGSLWLDMAPAR